MPKITLFNNEKDFQLIPAGQTIIELGQPGDHMYVIIDGQVKVTANDRELEVLGPGDIFGEMALVDHHPRSATVSAMTDCKLVAIDERRFKMAIQHNPYFALQVMSIMAERLRKRIE